jgi:hypothetical protein
LFLLRFLDCLLGFELLVGVFGYLLRYVSLGAFAATEFNEMFSGRQRCEDKRAFERFGS